MTATDAKLVQYVQQTLPMTVHLDGAQCGLPKSYSTPCVKEDFMYFFYWDTYFTNLGFYEIGMSEQAGNNLCNIAYLIERLGYMPNADILTDRSQPPLFVRGVYDYWKRTGDEGCIAKFLPAMLREYNFWMSERMTPCGLNRYRGQADSSELNEFNRAMYRRLKLDESVQPVESAGLSLLAVAESGWDFSSRFFNGSGCAALDICPVDLNAILYDAEQKLAEFLDMQGRRAEAREMAARAVSRRESMRKLMRNPQNGIYYDYDFKARTITGKLTAASLSAWAFSVEADGSGLSDVLAGLETDYGLLSSEYRKGERNFQWDYPMMWPPLAYIGAYAAIHAGDRNAAIRLMNKYCTTAEKVFSETGKLWEKYDVVHCGVGEGVEYETPPMMGWTAGVYLHFKSLLNNLF